MNALQALGQARHAWERSQPQLFFTDELLWPDSGLEEHGVACEDVTRRVEATVLLEPARIPSHRRGQDGLTVGAEPCCDPRELTVETRVPSSRSSHAAPPHPPRGGSAPLPNTTGPDATPSEGARPAQEVTS